MPTVIARQCMLLGTSHDRATISYPQVLSIGTGNQRSETYVCVQAVERQFPFRFAIPLESFICNTGGGGGSDSVLPTSYAASHSGQAQQGAQPHSQGRSSRMGGLPGWLRLPSSEPPSEPPPASTPSHQASGTEDSKFAGRGHVLGGTGALVIQV